jgi:3-methylcrotonyl-CoA carboxylase alpha subunit
MAGKVMFKKLLIANRGEICCRIIKTAKKMGLSTVAIYSDADADALHVQLADEAVNVGPAPSRESYLCSQKIIDIALLLGVDAIHPGYGFLSENADFCRLCEQNNIVFVGPPVGAIEAMGSKSAAKQIMEKAGVPLVPGYHGEQQEPELLKQHADKMGYPVLLKAAAGGGGKGMRQVWKESEFFAALDAAKRESLSSFNDEIMLVEKYLTQPRHVEIQVFCDNHGNGVYLFERDCSVQRRHQKVIEEAPAPGMTKEIRDAMGQAALKAAQAINYTGAGTVEFLLNEDGSFFFMEMNTRLQVEHPVTEMITGQDLVEWQLRVAANENLPLTQDQLVLSGHAFEARIYAEDPDNDFLPATGNLRLLRPPIESQFVRVDTGVVQGDDVSVYYDPMIAKLIVWDENRDKALLRLGKALSHYHIEGITTNIDFLYNLANCLPFKNAQLTTNFIEDHHAEIFVEKHNNNNHIIPLAALYLELAKQNHIAIGNADKHSPWANNNQWRANELHQQTLTIEIQSNFYELQVSQSGSSQSRYFNINSGARTYRCHGELVDDSLIATVDGHRTTSTVVNHDHGYTLFTKNHAVKFALVMPDLGLLDDNSGPAGFQAPMNGTVVALLVAQGEQVVKDQPLMIMEAMKMEHTLKAPISGSVSEFYYQVGELVDGGAELLLFASADEAE